ncbi:hypothetical protein SUGI_0283990 [Cryptomeria japonica]|uniref:G-type lectin S-receptor-like serine/threonine-protein kinase At2g19130 n=1 Tax=Cryptomeria japonica TaxID=3369 RepID=UPI002408D513|nr:G-type lectin S-receptor-like serine/threonine-protein kinase At2g19130 [Cryptomeria japonica]GLJ16584.1 hypothetical protein SUGI_0283990 [Cryptomeria japonica]
MDWSLKRFIFALVMLILQRNGDLLVDGGDTLSLGVSLREKQTIISKNGTFELGFFSPNGTSKWYVGIWYTQISVKTIVWVANRETPIKHTPGILTLSTSGYLTISDLQGKAVWSSNSTQQAKASRASILDSGNFVLLGSKNTSEIVWESFANPTDHLLPTMKFWKGLKLISWKSSVDPAPGPFIHQMDPSPGKNSFLLQYKNGVSYYSTGEWSGKDYATVPPGLSSTLYQQELVVFSPTRMYYMYSYTPNADSTVVMKEVLHENGEISRYSWANNNWNLINRAPTSSCGVYGVCGAYGVCFTQENIQLCECVQGFQPRDSNSWHSQEWWLSGCVRRTPLNCSAINGSRSDDIDGFLQISNTTLSDEEGVQYGQESSLLECKTACLNNCSCTAFSFTNSIPGVCKLWFSDLLGLQATSSTGQPSFIRLAASDVPQRGRLLGHVEDYDTTISLRTFTCNELKTATNNFTHMLGKGAFGSVFKGTLPEATLVAVKKLEGRAQSEKQFRAEISTIGNIQHVNLVRLRGFCVEGSQRMLVYDFLQNGSLDSFLSRKSKEADRLLDWKTRFGIALGTARALAYLHEGCRDRIIHCDIKPENILLDADFSPKIGDFGLAKLVGRDFSAVLTTTRGTRGYLAPEWICGLPITVKADVYSFGMTLLEIISGRRNIDLSVQESQYFPTWAATEIQKGNIMGIVDEKIADKADVEEVRRAAVVSIQCIQEDENRRPSMSQVVRMLEGISDGDVEL